MAVDMTGLVDIAKDKVGRKQVIALATIGVLGWLINTTPEVSLQKLLTVAGVGIAGIASQCWLDLKRPRNPKEPDGS